MPEYILPIEPLKAEQGPAPEINLGHMQSAPDVHIDTGGGSYDAVADGLAKLGNGQSPNAKYAPSFFNWEESNADRYVQNDNYKALGFDPFLGFQTIDGKPYDSNELKYQKFQDWGDVISNGIGGSGSLAWNTFKGAAVSDGRMLNALFNPKSWYQYATDEATFEEKFIGTPQQLLEEDKTQKAIMNKYAIYESPETQGIFNKEFIGSNLQQLGFTIGTGAYIAAETILTSGLADALLPITKAKLLTKIGKAMDATTDATQLQQLQQLAESAKSGASKAKLINDLKSLNDVAKNRTFMETMWDGFKKHIPLYGPASDVTAAIRAGATVEQSMAAGVPGLIKSYTMFNAAKAEASMEAAGTYGQMYADLIDKFEKDNGREPDSLDLERIQQAAYNASTDNFAVNTGILSIMNEIEFGNIMSKFSSSKRLFREAAEDNGMGMFTVEGKVKTGANAGKYAARTYETGRFGAMGKFNSIRKEFGLGTALWEGAKSWTKGGGKFQISEGIQEILQTASDNTFRDYYTNLYDANKDLNGSILKSATSADWEKGLASQMNQEGWKTFLMGATTGLFLSPLSGAAMYGLKKGQSAVNPTYKDQLTKQQELIKENVQILNSFYDTAADNFFAHIANVKTQMHGTSNMKRAMPADDKYTFFNMQGDALSKAAATAIKTGNINSLLSTIRSLGDGRMTDEEFATSIGLPEGEKVSAREYTEKVAKDIEQYYSNWQKLKDKFSDLVMPEMYAKSNDYAIVATQKAALNEAIELLATTDQNAQTAIIRASEIRTRMSNLKTIGSSVSLSFDILGSKEQTNKEIKSLKGELKLIDGVKEAGMAARTKSLETQIKFLEDWQKSYDEYERSYKNLTDKDIEDNPQLEDDRLEIMEALEDAYHEYITFKNKETGIGPNTVSRLDLEEAFQGLSDYITLTNDHEKYVEAFNTLTHPRNFRLAYGKVVEAMNHAKEKSKEKAEAEINARAKATAPTEAEETTPIPAASTITATDTEGVIVTAPEPVEVVTDTEIVPEGTEVQPKPVTQSTVNQTTPVQSTEAELAPTVGTPPVTEVAAPVTTFDYKPKFSEGVVFGTTGRHFMDKEDKIINQQESTHVAYATSEDLLIEGKDPMFLEVATKDHDPYGIHNPQFPNGVKVLLTDENGNPIDKDGIIPDPKGAGKDRLVHWYLKELHNKSIQEIIDRFKNDYNVAGVSEEDIEYVAKKYKATMDAILKDPANAKIVVNGKRQGIPYLVALVDGKVQKLPVQNRLLKLDTNWKVMTHPNGMRMTLKISPNGRPYMQREDGQIFKVYNRDLFPTEKQSVVNALKYMSKFGVKRDSTQEAEYQKLQEILHSTIFFGVPEDVNNPGANRLWIADGKLWKREGNKNISIPLIDHVIEKNKDRFMENVYRNVNNKMINEVNRPYVDRKVIANKDGSYTIENAKEWENYQHALLAGPEERLHMPEGERNPVLHTNVERYLLDSQETHPQVKQVELLWEFLGQIPEIEKPKPKIAAKPEDTLPDITNMDSAEKQFPTGEMSDEELDAAWDEYRSNPFIFKTQKFKDGKHLVSKFVRNVGQAHLFEQYIQNPGEEWFTRGGNFATKMKVEEPVKPVAPNVEAVETKTDIDKKKKDIENRRKKELSIESKAAYMGERGNETWIDAEERVNKKYDAELKALEPKVEQPTSQEVIEEVTAELPTEAIVNPTNAEVTNQIDEPVSPAANAEVKKEWSQEVKNEKSTRKTNLDKFKDCE